jgi:voltage-gated potassium channel
MNQTINIPMDETRKEWLFRIIFGTDTPAGRRFDVMLIVTILASVIAVTIDSMPNYQDQYSEVLFVVEWIFTLLFTVEYAIRLYCSPNPKAYTTSFYGIVDLLAVLPTYIAIFVSGANFLLIIRLLRVLRIFRVLKLLQYSNEAQVLLRAMIMARRKIFVFFFCVLIVVSIFGSLMYVIEGAAYGFTSIPKGIYWAIVTVTTVGYGDITPHTILGQCIAAIAMLTGYAILAVPTGIISAELIHELKTEKLTSRCGNCEKTGHERDADYCKHCGTQLQQKL